MNMGALMQQAQKMQKEMEKQQKELEAKLFEVYSAGGAITISIYGSRKVNKITIDEDAVSKEDKDMLEDMLVVAMNEAMSIIDKEFEKLNARLQSSMRMPF